MSRAGKAKDLFTASEVARFCQVDLKTIHNWADREEIRHFRTPGRHLRFRRADVLDFLRRYGYPIPEVLMQGRPRIMLLDDDAEVVQSAKRVLGKNFDVTVYEDVVDALIHLGKEAPDALVVGSEVGGFKAAHLIDRLQHAEHTRHVRTVVLANGGSSHKALDAGASAHVSRGDAHHLRETLEALMGLER